MSSCFRMHARARLTNSLKLPALNTDRATDAFQYSRLSVAYSQQHS